MNVSILFIRYAFTLNGEVILMKFGTEIEWSLGKDIIDTILFLKNPPYLFPWVATAMGIDYFSKLPSQIGIGNGNGMFTFHRDLLKN